MNVHSWKPYAFWILFTEAVGALSGWLTREGTRSYAQTSVQPPLSPPGWVFPVVWGVLFALMGTGAARVDLRPASPERTRGLRLYFLAAPFAGVNIILAVYFASVEQAVPAQAVSLLRGILVILPMAVALAAAFGMVGVWVAFPVSEALVALVAWVLLRRCRRTLYPASRES